MRSLPLTLLAVATLLSPAAALAATSTPSGTGSGANGAPSPAPTSRTFEIRGLVLGEVRIDASGKLGYEGSQLFASAGCNLIGGTVTVDGDTVTIVGPTFMTEMDCQGTDGTVEDTLIKILELKTFTISDGAWTADGGSIITVEIPSAGPGPSGPPPDEPISTGVPTIIDPAPSCPPLPSNSSSTVGGGPADGGSGSGSGGSGGTSTATAGTGVAEPGATAVAEPAATADDLPLSTGSVEPGSPGVEPPPPAPVPDQTFSLGQVEPGPTYGVVEPVPPIGTSPGVGKPVDPCLDYASGANDLLPGQAVPPKGTDVAASEHAARDAASQNVLLAPLTLLLGVLVLIGARRFRRDLPTRP